MNVNQLHLIEDEASHDNVFVFSHVIEEKIMNEVNITCEINMEVIYLCIVTEVVSSAPHHR
jgi:hypothetical protein